MLNGGVIYCAGDMLAALIQTQFDWRRMLGFLIVGATLYAFEVPNWFRWIDEKTANMEGLKASLAKTGLAIAYFNPLWIARHLFFILLFSGKVHDVTADLFRIAALSFVVNIPVSICANYLIQNVVKLKWRFLASALFSGIMAVYFAMSASWFA
ncbi:MAG: hypothetical protein GY822_19330 [Deltaproteobacteria bacterium]|nr:hypothetical protein [Deltaproteobacteria bacterium]